jgi:hypothetical protein
VSSALVGSSILPPVEACLEHDRAFYLKRSVPV